MGAFWRHFSWVDTWKWALFVMLSNFLSLLVKDWDILGKVYDLFAYANKEEGWSKLRVLIKAVFKRIAWFAKLLLNFCWPQSAILQLIHSHLVPRGLKNEFKNAKTWVYLSVKHQHFMIHIKNHGLSIKFFIFIMNYDLCT